MKGKEIERRFWVHIDNIPNLSKYDYRDITQGYANGLGDYQFRLRQVINITPNEVPIGEQYYQTIKSYGNMVRDEFEIGLLKPQFSKLWGLCSANTLHKHRYDIIGTNGDKIFLDIFKNDLFGLVLAEVEFTTIDEANSYKPEEWFGKEITDDDNFKNYLLAKNGLTKIISLDGLNYKCVKCGKLFLTKRPHKCIEGVKNFQSTYKLDMSV